jgi:hypothetical protein
LPSSALFRTASATNSGCFFLQGEDILSIKAVLSSVHRDRGKEIKNVEEVDRLYRAKERSASKVSNVEIRGSGLTS